MKELIITYFTKFSLLIGLEVTTLVGLIILLFLDFVLDLFISYSLYQKMEFKKNVLTYILKTIFSIALIGVIFSFTFQLPLIFISIFNSVLTIIILDNLWNITNSIGKVTKDSSFIEITKLLKEKFNSNKDDKPTDKPL